MKEQIRRAASKVRDGFIRAVTQVRNMPVRAMLAFVIALGFGLWLGPRAGILWFLFFLFLFYEWDNRVIGVFALISLASCPFFLSFGYDDLAEIMAQYAYFFLVMTVALQIVEFKRHPPPSDEAAVDGSWFEEELEAGGKRN